MARRFAIAVIAAVVAIVAGICGCGRNSPGRAAAEEALRDIDNLFQARANKTVFLQNLPAVRAAIDAGERAGDPKLKGDREIIGDLDSCKSALASYEGTFYTPDESKDDEFRLVENADEEQVARCISDLKKDLGQ